MFLFYVKGTETEREIFSHTGRGWSRLKPGTASGISNGAWPKARHANTGSGD